MSNLAEKVLLCYHCGNNTSMKRVAHHLQELSELHWYGQHHFTIDFSTIWELFLCPVCTGVTLEKSRWNSEEIDEKGSSLVQMETLYPTITANSDNMPMNVHNAFEAAIKVKKIDGALCAVSLRRTLEMMCKDRGAEGRSLLQMLRDLSTKGILPPIVDGMANILRHLGNEAAHAVEREFTEEIVSELIEFTQIILDYVYILPERLVMIQRKIDRRTDPTEPTDTN